MTNLDRHRAPHTTTAITAPLPPPRQSIVGGGGEITIRKAMLPPPRGAGGADFMFIDDLQKKHANMVGFMPKDQLEKNIASGKVLIAQNPATTERIGYCIFNDKYFKREDLGIIYQLNIVPHMQRGLVGAALVKAAFEACPWGVKLFCCWCAQDLAANHFWESIGFVPIAFRSGSRGKEHGGTRKEGRMQIMWQKRIREGDFGPPTGTPYWYPTETSGGAMKENRIVLPMPPDKHWSDELPFVLPGPPTGQEDSGGPKALPAARKGKAKAASSVRTPALPAPPARPKRGLWFVPPTPPAAPPPTPSSPPSDAIESKALVIKRERPRRRNDPKHIAFARELRDRYLDEVNTGRMLPGGTSPGGGKYDVSRALPACDGPLSRVESLPPMLNAA